MFWNADRTRRPPINKNLRTVNSLLWKGVGSSKRQYLPWAGGRESLEEIDGRYPEVGRKTDAHHFWFNLDG